MMNGPWPEPTRPGSIPDGDRGSNDRGRSARRAEHGPIGRRRFRSDATRRRLVPLFRGWDWVAWCGQALLRRPVPLAVVALVAGVFVSLVWVTADVLSRNHWPDGVWLAHVAFGLCCTAAVMLPVCFGLGMLLGMVPALRSPRINLGFQVGVGFAAGALALPTARWAFSGSWIGAQPMARFGPALVVLSIAMLGVLACRWVQHCVRCQRAGRWLQARFLALGLACFGVLGLTLDLNWYVSLYARLHTALEIFSGLCLAIAVGLMARELELRRPLVRAGCWALTLPSSILMLMSLSDGALQRFDIELNHAYREQVLVGRQLRRLRAVRAVLAAPTEWKGEQAAALSELTERFDLVSTEPDPRWSAATPPPAPAWRGSCGHCSLVVFYVDTLRQDTALDAGLMPHLAKFNQEAVSFQRAYSTGSDTLNALPELTSGHYPPTQARPGDLLRVALQLGMTTTLAIPRSAREFLHKLHPDFEFDETWVVPDYAVAKLDVWGYGADRFSSRQLVDETLQWLDTHPKQRFLSWIFNFEVHSWRELDETQLLEVAREAGLPTDGDKSWRYRAAAHHVDQQFGRLLQGLKDLGRDRDTIVLFVSDHGEALGQWDFWLHSVVVWESLVRVPLAMRVPGFPARQVPTAVSLIDVTPTLTELLGAPSSTYGYQGHPLPLTDAPAARRTAPILFVGQRKDTLVRIGALDSRARYKLVLPLEVGVPELYDTQALDPDNDNLALDQPLKVAELLDVIVRSPMYPRQPETASDPAHAASEPTQ